MQTSVSWHSIPAPEAVKILSSNLKLGLNEKEVILRQSQYGPNKLAEEKLTPRWLLFLRQFKSPLVFILVVAGAVTLWFHKYTDSSVIFGAVLLNTAIGYIQENKATKALSRLKKILRQKALVVREGRKREVLQEKLVPGDIIMFTEGSKVPADARILESFELRINEAVLTGEWLASAKKEAALDKKTPLADRDNMAYMGSFVEAGNGKAVVVAIGKETELGRISQLLSKVKEEKTPYQKKLGRFSWIIGSVIALLTSFIFVEGVLMGKEGIEMFTISLALSVASLVNKI